MGAGSEIETDYLVVGAGALGMGFVDTLIEHADVDVVIIDRRHRPGGHWLDSYPFVQLHQPSMNYGVNSTPLGHDRIEGGGRDAGFYERATGPEICGYYDDVMRYRFLPSGRTRFFPMSEYLGGTRFRSRLTGTDTDVSVRHRVVDATYMASHVPATDPPPFEVADGVRCVPVGGLTTVTTPPAGYVIIGAGKTAMDAACWLLDRGTPPDDITWIRPRDSWILNRAFFQPGRGVVATFEGIVVELEAVAECDSIERVYERLEEHQIVFRVDRSIQPSMLKGATASLDEVDELRRIKKVVRLGHVERIDVDAITLEQGSVTTSPDHLHVHCASAGLSDNAPKPIFADGTVTLQPITRVSLSLSAGLIGVVEASGRTTADKNRLCQPNPWPHTPFDFTRHLLTGMRTELEWRNAPDVVAWTEASRLNLVKDLEQDPDNANVADLQRRFLTALFPALTKFDEFAAHATPAERSRMFEPA
ncbi:MAG TPA: NAD(P)-binding protein [Acidimicrobiia bacterium]|nr:NAD(P)-binding protein [Acidimicrobiia bacterium]